MLDSFCAACRPVLLAVNIEHKGRDPSRDTHNILYTSVARHILPATVSKNKSRLFRKAQLAVSRCLYLYVTSLHSSGHYGTCKIYFLILDHGMNISFACDRHNEWVPSRPYVCFCACIILGAHAYGHCVHLFEYNTSLEQRVTFEYCVTPNSSSLTLSVPFLWSSYRLLDEVRQILVIHEGCA